jgi:hypothetical protein
MADGDDGGVKRRAAQKRADDLVGRFPVTDLGHALALTGSSRQQFLRRFVERKGGRGNFTPLRAQLPRIYAAHGPEAGSHGALFRDLPPDGWDRIEASLRDTCEPQHLDTNLMVGRMVFDHARGSGYTAVTMKAPPLRVHGKPTVPVGIDFYLVQGDKVILQFVHLRSAELSARQRAIMATLIFEACGRGELEEAQPEVEFVSFCAPKAGQPRQTVLRSVPRDKFVPLSTLNDEIAEVFDILRRIATGEA